MNKERIEDIESEIGRNGWRLVGRIGTVVGIIVSLPVVTGFIWVGALGQTVEDQGRDINAHESKISSLERSSGEAAVSRAEALVSLAYIEKQLELIYQELKALKYNRRQSEERGGP